MDFLRSAVCVGTPFRYTVRQSQLLRAIVLGSIIPSVYGIIQHTHLIPAIPYQSRVTSLFLNADFCGAYFGLMIMLTLTLYLSNTLRTTHGYLALLAIQFIALVYSYTRSAWLGALMGIGLFGCFSLFQTTGIWKRLLLFLGLIAVCFSILNLHSHNQVSSRASSIASDVRQVLTNNNIDYAGSGRWYIWKGSLPIIKNHPLLGTGPDTFESAFVPPKNGPKQYLVDQSISNANNNYLQIAVTLGIPALIVFLAFLWMTVSFQWTYLKKSNWHNGITIGLISAVISYLVQAFFNIDVLTVAPMFWIVLAMTHNKPDEACPTNTNN